MNAIKCKQCAGNVPVGYGIEGFVCPYCGAKDSVAPEIRERIDNYYDSLRRFDVKIKQIPEVFSLQLQRMTAKSTDTILYVGVLILSVGSAWVGTFQAYWGNWPDSLVGWMDFITVYMPMILPVFIFPWLFFTSWRRRHLLEVFHARMPLQPGGSARCRLCGGPLPDSGVLRRCEHCGTDSIVAEKTVSKYGDDLAAEIERVESKTEERLNRNIKTLRGLCMFAPIFYQAALFALMLITGGIAALLHHGTPNAAYKISEYKVNALAYLVGLAVIGWLMIRRWREWRKEKAEYIRLEK